MKVTLKLTSDHDDCELNIFDRCNRSRDHSFQADEKSLFLNHIYSIFYSILLKCYLTFFDIKQDFFHSFFNSEADDLNQRSHLERSQIDIIKNQNVMTRNQDHVIKDQDEMMRDQDHVIKDQDEMMKNQNHVIKNQNEMIENQDQIIKNQNKTTKNQDHITKNEKISIDTLILYNAKTQLTSQSSLTLKEMSDTMKNNVDQEKEDQSRFSMREFKQQNQNDVISFTKISRLLFKTQMNKKKHLFMMLSLIIDNRFHKHQVNSLNKLSMITALELSYESQFMT